MADKKSKKTILDTLGESQVWKSIIRSGVPRTRRQRMHAVLGSVFLHLHPARLPKHAVKLGYTWCMGGLSFFLFVNLTITGILLMFYYRPTVEYAYTDIIDLAEQVPLGIMRELHRWAAHSMVLVVWLHMLRVFMTGSYKPPREFNWGVGVLLTARHVVHRGLGHVVWCSGVVHGDPRDGGNVDHTATFRPFEERKAVPREMEGRIHIGTHQTVILLVGKLLAQLPDVRANIIHEAIQLAAHFLCDVIQETLPPFRC